MSPAPSPFADPDTGSVRLMSETPREFDVIVYGATGFAGKLTAQYLSRAGGDARIGLAGRSAERLRAVRDELGTAAQDWPIVVADAEKSATLEAMAARTRVVITTVGPYTRYGMPLVAACAAAGTDYVDLTGEAMFVRESIDRYHRQAAENRARIVHACGFDSIPSDMSVYALYRAARDEGTGDLLDTDLVVRGFSGGVSGGTLASMIEVLSAVSSDPEVRRRLADPHTLSVDRIAEPRLGPEPDLSWRRGRDIAPELDGIWTAGFAMAPYNTRIVRRSNGLLDWAYGRRFRYAEHMSTGSSAAAPVLSGMATALGKVTFGLGGHLFRLLPSGLLDRVLPKPGTGPSRSTRENGYYRLETYTTTSTGARYLAVMAQQGDPGYQATSVLLGESALALALDRDALSDHYGVLTPAAAMGDALLVRLRAAGVTLDVSRLN